MWRGQVDRAVLSSAYNHPSIALRFTLQRPIAPKALCARVNEVCAS